VNTSRGEVVREADLVAVLGERLDLRVAVDTLGGEVTATQFNSPLVPLHQRGQVLITPHIAGATVESQEKAARAALAALERHLAGTARPAH
jgi:phosphoglycerate dehydrogenase-like enzyme